MELRFKFLIFLLVGWLSWSSAFAQGGPPSAADVRAMPNDTNKVKAWSRLVTRTIPDNLDSAMAYADSTLALAERLDFDKGRALGNEKIGMVYNYRGKLQNALKFYDKALQFHLAQGNERSAAIIMSNMGMAKRNLGAFDEAMVYYFDALELQEKLGDTNDIAYALKNIGEQYAIQNNYEKAEEFFGRALAGYRAAKNTPMEYTMILNLGGFYKEKGDFDKAMDYILQARDYFEKNGPKPEIARSYYNLGGTYLGLGELDKSEKAYEEAKEYFDTLGFSIRVVGCLISLGEVAQKKGNFQHAINLVNEALTLARKLGTKGQISRALFRLSQIYEAKEDYKRALEYRVSHESMEDSISNEETEKTIAELQEKYQSELSERQVAELTAINSMNELKVKKQRNQQSALIGMVFLTLVVAILLFNQYRSKKKNHDLLMEKNTIIQTSLNEKEVLLKEIHHRVKNNLQFISSLLNLQARHATDQHTAQVLKEGKHRVNSMSLVHQKLYQEDNLKGVEMSSYISNLLDSLIHSYEIDRTKVSVNTELQEIYLDIDTAIPLGLILNELITNVFKYAFEGRGEGAIEILFREEDDALTLMVSDNGVGLPENFKIEESEQFGFEIIRSLATKLKASVDISNGSGTTITLQIHQYNKA